MSVNTGGAEQAEIERLQARVNYNCEEDQCFNSLQERLRYLAQVAKHDVMADALSRAADRIEELEARVVLLDITCNAHISEIEMGEKEIKRLNAVLDIAMTALKQIQTNLEDDPGEGYVQWIVDLCYEGQGIRTRGGESDAT